LHDILLTLTKTSSKLNNDFEGKTGLHNHDGHRKHRMTNSKQHFDFNQYSAVELRETLRQALPTLEKLVLLAREFCGENTPSASSPCKSCAKKDNCPGFCNDLEKQLPKVNSGRSSRENLTGLYSNTIQQRQRVTLLDQFEAFQHCKHLFTRKQWEVIHLYYRECKTQQQIADVLGIARSSISNRLKRAKKTLITQGRLLRREQLDLLRELQEDET
jgi:RNA polymerase sigma factor (sigma-70 family)